MLCCAFAFLLLFPVAGRRHTLIVNQEALVACRNLISFEAFPVCRVDDFNEDV
jgi:hypothetical protein